VEKLIWIPIILFHFIPTYMFDALLCWNWSFSPPNRMTLQITLLSLCKLTHKVSWPCTHQWHHPLETNYYIQFGMNHNWVTKVPVW
jgi:hypothetical protein